MKKLILIPILLLSILCNAQFTKGGGMFLKTGSSFMTAPVVPPPDFYDEYDTIYAAFTTKPHDTIAEIQEALVYSLDTAGYWDRMDLFYVFASHDSVSGYINWKDPGTFDAFEGTTGYTWDQWEGFTGNGTNARIRTGWIANDDAVNYTLNSASMGVYTRTNLAEGVSYYIAGAYSSGFGTLQLAFTTGTSAQWRINSTADYESSTAAPPGMFIVSRTAADACALYKNGASVEAVADASVALPVAEFYALDVRDGTANQISILYVMNGTANATEADEINDIIETYMDALGKGIQ